MKGVTFPNESDDYRQARDELLAAEVELRAQIERVAEQRRQLPPGGELKMDYEFDELVDGEVKKTRLSELFQPGHDVLFIYSFMYAPSMKRACQNCTSILDGLDGQVQHIDQRISTAVIAKHDIHTLHEHANSRGWRNLRLLSSQGNSYNVDYFGTIDGRESTTATVFQRDGETIRHFWSTELNYVPMAEGGGDVRHFDLAWPLWNVLDMTPAGRGDWYPSLSYDD